MIEEITGERPQYMRPPYGDWNEELECRVGMTTVLWSVDSLDWKLRNTNRVVKRVLKDVEDGDIILMHDIFPLLWKQPWKSLTRSRSGAILLLRWMNC